MQNASLPQAGDIIPQGKWYQEATINGVKMTPRRHSDTSEGRWNSLIEPLLPFRGEGRVVTDLGCNAGFYSRKLIDLGFKATGVEKNPMFVSHARYWEESDPKGLKIIEADLNEYNIPASHIVLLANVHYWLTPEQVSRLVKKLKKRALYVIVMGRYRTREGAVIRGNTKLAKMVSPCGIDALRDVFKGWWETKTIYGKGESYRYYSVIFKNPQLLEKDIEELTLWPPSMKYKGFSPALNKFIDLVVSGEKFEPSETDYFRYLKRRNFSEKDRRMEKRIHLVRSITKEGVKVPLGIGKVINDVYDENSIWSGDHRFVIAKRTGIKKLICKVRDEVEARQAYAIKRQSAAWREREKNPEWKW
ncbi:hypothetical protein ACFL13_03000 [Patescibacteria group bacterium]